MKGFCSLASGSKGNCLFLGTEKTKILIDVGISNRLVQKRLEAINVDLKQIEAILITHEHSDHIQGLKVITKKYKIPIFCNAQTAKGICEGLQIHPRFKIFTTGEMFEYKDLVFHPFSIRHDTLDPIGLTIKYDRCKIGICTDLGMVTSMVVKHLQKCDYLYLEANHHPAMVLSSPRSHIYKRRVLGRQGHLSNQECVYLLSQILHDELKHIYLAHLSSECNTPELALKIVREFLQKENKDVQVSVALQNQISEKTYF